MNFRLFLTLSLACLASAQAEEQANKADCQQMADALIALGCKATGNKVTFEQVMKTSEGKAAHKQRVSECVGAISKSQVQKSTQCAQNADSQAEYDRCMSSAQNDAAIAAALASAPKGASTASASNDPCTQALLNVYYVIAQNDPDITDAKQFVGAVQATKDFQESLKECRTSYPQDTVQCLIRAKSEQAIDLCTGDEDDDDDSAIKAQKAHSAGPKASADECKAAIENAFRISLAQDPETAQMIDVYMKTIYDMSEYKEAIQECRKEMTSDEARCVARARNESDIDNCD